MIAEVHGMSQRGGSVVTHLKFGTKVLSPLVDKAYALVAFEPLEALRNLEYINKRTTVLIANYKIEPKRGKYPPFKHIYVGSFV